ncbi:MULTISPECIES: hypothetical protein [Halorubrum]|uniref:Uncharacterized protein n=1 Tax=Halorubrum sodomense TaxID=35743 RepID=A0A1I6FK25_HALSD|nr:MULTISPECIES: hypothetical protein [Halorubrum]TKX54092.1 hypothetical protein EXE42_10090 [Halorubrum sp. SP3]SFR30281.1 hypothetical protein SAMN04487937_0098 [Halorubrum sodomense]
MTDRSAERPAERARDRAGEATPERSRGRGDATVPVASMDVAPELFPAEPTGDETERGAE